MVYVCHFVAVFDYFRLSKVGFSGRLLTFALVRALHIFIKFSKVILESLKLLRSYIACMFVFLCVDLLELVE